jgi:hypothetical protein
MPLNIERSRTTNGSISGLPRKGKIRAILNNGLVSNLDHAATIQQTMIFHQHFLPGLAIASYLVGDEKTRECAVVDASSGLSALAKADVASNERSLPWSGCKTPNFVGASRSD